MENRELHVSNKITHMPSWQLRVATPVYLLHQFCSAPVFKWHLHEIFSPVCAGLNSGISPRHPGNKRPAIPGNWRSGGAIDRFIGADFVDRQFLNAFIIRLLDLSSLLNSDKEDIVCHWNFFLSSLFLPRSPVIPSMIPPKSFQSTVTNT